jgi:hypothetical protein
LNPDRKFEETTTWGSTLRMAFSLSNIAYRWKSEVVSPRAHKVLKASPARIADVRCRLVMRWEEDLISTQRNAAANEKSPGARGSVHDGLSVFCFLARQCVAD